MPILMDLSFGSPTVWLGLSAGLDRARRLPAGSSPRSRKLGLIFGVAEGSLSVVLFGRAREYPRTQRSRLRSPTPTCPGSSRAVPEPCRTSRKRTTSRP